MLWSWSSQTPERWELNVCYFCHLVFGIFVTAVIQTPLAVGLIIILLLLTPSPLLFLVSNPVHHMVQQTNLLPGSHLYVLTATPPWVSCAPKYLAVCPKNAKPWLIFTRTILSCVCSKQPLETRQCLPLGQRASLFIACYKRTGFPAQCSSPVTTCCVCKHLCGCPVSLSWELGNQGTDIIMLINAYATCQAVRDKVFCILSKNLVSSANNYESIID